MAGSYDIGPRVGVTGENEFKKQISEINNHIKTLGTEMKAVTAEYGKNEKSIVGAIKQQKILDQEVASQKKIVKETAAALKSAEAEYGKNSKQVEAWRQKLNTANAALSDMKSEQKAANKELKDSLSISVQLEKAYNGLKERVSEVADRHKILIGSLKLVGKVAKTVAVGVGAAAAAGGAAFVSLSKTVVESYGELEQNLGGAEAVFGENAKSIEKISEDAYRTMGTTQSEYLAVANKTAALFQGSGVSTARSANLTARAMQRAADMASVMGIETSDALEAITGAAKGNYTMMDNLGVAMNNTTLEMYLNAQKAKGALGNLASVQTALKKEAETGKAVEIKFADLTGAEKAEVAMKYFFEKTEQYAGNFEREATQTISGSIGLLKAATSSFIAGLGNDNADIQNLMGNVVDAFRATVKNIVPVLKSITGNIKEMLPEIKTTIHELTPELVDIIVELAPPILEATFALIKELALSLGDAMKENWPAIKDAGIQLVKGLWEGIKDMGSWIKDKLAEFAGGVLDNIKGFFGIHSPSTVMKDQIGKNLALGIGEGFEGGMKGVTKEMTAAIPHDLSDLKANVRSSLIVGGLQKGKTSGGTTDGGGKRDTVYHTGTIRIEGVSDDGQFRAVRDYIIEDIRRELRRA